MADIPVLFNPPRQQTLRITVALTKQLTDVIQEEIGKERSRVLEQGMRYHLDWGNFVARLIAEHKRMVETGRLGHISMPKHEAPSKRPSMAHRRRAVFERDLGVCGICGEDTVALKRSFLKWVKEYVDPNNLGGFFQGENMSPARWRRKQRESWMQVNDIPFHREDTDWWDLDHVVPGAELGDWRDYRNLRTLCIPCHKEVTRLLHLRTWDKRGRRRTLDLRLGAEEVLWVEKESAQCQGPMQEVLEMIIRVVLYERRHPRGPSKNLEKG